MVWVAVVWVVGRLDSPILRSKLWKEPEVVQEVERYRLEISKLTSSMGPGTQLLERGWTLHYSWVPRMSGGGLL